MIPFVHLHVHSQYSLLDGQAAVKKIVDKAIADGMRGVALTDHGNMFGIKEFHDYCNKKNGDALGEIKGLKKALKAEQEKDTPDEDEIARINAQIAEAEGKLFKPIFGCEAYVAFGAKEDHIDKRDIGRHLILLAKNLKGYKNLIKIVSRSWTDGFYSHPRTDHADLERYHEGVICCSACLGGEIPQAIMRGELEKARETARWYKSVFGDDYYIELQLHKSTSPDGNQETYVKQVEVNEELVKIARELDIKLICSNDSHYVNEDDYQAHRRLIWLSTGRNINDPGMMLYTGQEWFKTTAEMNELFAHIPEALQNTNEILDKVEIYSIDHGPILPDFPLPDGFDNEDDYLRYLVYEGAKERWGDDLNDEYRERLDFELETIKNMGFPGYFLIVQDYIRVAPSLGVSVGPGRGSAAGSAVAYCLGITKIDPIKYDLLFERFLNPDRISLPDIDVDFDDDGRAKILKYVTDKYGAEKVAHIITYGSMAAKMAIKDVARVQGLSIDESNRLAALIPSKPNDMPKDENGNPYKLNLSNCLKHIPEFEQEKRNPNPFVADTIKFAEKLEGNIRGTGVHACGVIIGRDDITDWVPVSTAVDKEDGRVLVTQYEGGVIESTGLIKMDFLGLKTLSIISDALVNIKKNYGKEIDIEKIPIDDPKTYQLYCEGRTTGTFQFESPGMQKYLKELHPTTFEDLIAMNALYRPGPMEYIPQFINRKHGVDPIIYDIPCMEKYLKDTYGITVYQEQVMLLSRQLANFTRGQSDTLRKAMGKKQIDKMNHLEGLFYEGGEKNGYKHEVLKKIWEDWKKFASYAFNKSHATCYSWVAYQTAYLKANYPSEYMAAVLTRSGDIEKQSKFMDECRAMGIEVLRPDINESNVHFTPNKNGYIRLGLGDIKGVGSNGVEAVIAEREKNGPFKSIYDLVERVDLSACNRKAIESFAIAGAFDCFKDVSRECFVKEGDTGVSFSETLVRFGQKFKAGASTGPSLWGDLDEVIEIARPPIPVVEPWSDIERLDREKELVGMYLSAHPLDNYYMEMKYGCNCELANLDSMTEHLDKEIIVGGIVTDYRQGLTKKGNSYGRLKLEDYSGSYEFAFFDRDFIDYGKFGQKGLFITITGAFKKGYGDRISFKIRSINLLSEMKGRMVHSVTIELEDSDLEKMYTVKSMMNESTENRCDLFFRVIDSESHRSVDLRSKMKIPMNKKMVNLFNDLGLKFKINQ